MSCEETLQRLLTANEALVQLPDEAPRRRRRSGGHSDQAGGAAAEQQDTPLPAVPLDPSSENTRRNGNGGSQEDAAGTSATASNGNGAVHPKDPAQEGLKAAMRRYERVASGISEHAGEEGSSRDGGPADASLGRSLSPKGGPGLTPSADAAVQHDAAVGPAASKLVEPTGRAPCAPTWHARQRLSLSCAAAEHVLKQGWRLCRGGGAGERMQCGLDGAACSRRGAERQRLRHVFPGCKVVLL